jgi:fatty-acyl-CoA synthase
MNFQNITQVLEHAFKQYPEKIAVHLLFSQQPAAHISYQQLALKASRFAQALQLDSIEPNEVVIIVLKHSQELLLSFFGVMLRGAIPSIMPFMTEKLQPEQYRSALEALFKITQPAAVITYRDFFHEVEKASSNTSIRKIIVAEDIFPADGQTEITPASEIDFTALAGKNRQLNDIALLQHSSGTTGLQKGIALSHQSIFNQLASYKNALNFSENDCVSSWLPLYHDMGLIAGFMMPILLGASLVLLSPFDWVRAPYKLFQAISQYQSTFCWLPNFAYNFCAQKIRDKDLEGVDLSSVKAFVNCSEPIYWSSHRIFFERFSQYGLKPTALATSYAMAENVFAVTQGGINSPVVLDRIDRLTLLEKQFAQPAAASLEQDKALLNHAYNENANVLTMVSAGHPIQGTRISVLDEAGNPLAERRIGEIAIQSNCMLTGYYHRPDLTEKAFKDGWYLTGDLGYQVKDQVFITGRKKDLIIVGGKNIYPQDLERLASGVEGVYPGRVVAFGVQNESGGTEDVVLVAETTLDDEAFDNPGLSEEFNRISLNIRQQVTQGSDISLRYVHLVRRNWLIKTSSGKIARSANRNKYLAETS